MTIALFDTNIIIDSFAGHDAATAELSNYSDAAISSISWMEVACKLGTMEQLQFQTLLDGIGIKIIHINDAIMKRATILRGDSIANPPKIQLLDCIIRATAEVEGRLLVTRNPRDFGRAGAAVRVPYDIVNGVAVNIRPSPP
jgi:predicted nucleic acid-binding protein